jgi:indole-3-glycerol phosphate synthase
VLIILAILSDEEATELASLAQDLGMDVLMETHTEGEVARATAIPHDLLGINNRNLKNFATDEAVALGLSGRSASDKPVVAESGLKSPEAICRNWQAGVRRFLVGEAFVRAGDPEATVRSYCEAVTAVAP